MNLALRIFAAVIDILQFLFFVALLAFQAMTPIGGGVAGAAAGAYLCWNMSSGVWEGVVNATTCALGGGAAASIISAFATPIGMAIDVALTATFGVVLLCLMFVSGRFYFMTVVIGFAAEMMPGVNGFAPAWSIMVHRCISQYNQEQKQSAAASPAPKQEARVSLQAKNFEGIRAANDNRPKPTYAKAA